MPQDWDIKPRDEACHACGTAFEDRQVYHSCLVFGDAGYTRADYCAVCWQQHADTHASYSVWQGVFRLPPPEPEEPLKKETAESLLRRLMEEEDPAHVNVIYILAVMLERKRILAEKDVQTHEDGSMIRIYEHRKSGETFLVPDPRLSLDQLEPVQEQVLAMLGSPGGEKEAEQAGNGAPGNDEDKDQRPEVEQDTPAPG